MIDEEARETCRQMLRDGVGRAGGQQTPGPPGAPPLRGHHRCLLMLCRTAAGAREMGCILHPQAALGVDTQGSWWSNLSFRKSLSRKKTSGGEEPGFLSVGFQILFLIVNTRLSPALCAQRSGSVCVCVCVCVCEKEGGRERLGGGERVFKF